MNGRDGHDSFAALNLPRTVHAQASKLLMAISQACTVTYTLRATDRAEGFTLGHEAVRALNSGTIEGLYLAFYRALQAHQLELEQ